MVIAVHARAHFGDDKTLYWRPYTSTRWGNALSPYWQARALAELAGHGFSAYQGFTSSWLKYLPKDLAPGSCPRPKKLTAACQPEACDSSSWVYAHRCNGAWQFIRPTIIHDTHAAVAAWAAASNHTLPNFEAGDVVIQSRCSRDALCSHAEYGPVAFSFYSNIDQKANNIYIVSHPRERLPTCAAIHAAQVQWLQERHPAANVQHVGGSLEQDFFRLLFAPVLFKDAQSSFGLWAGLANGGHIWSVPLLTKYAKDSQPDLGITWHWVDAPVLYPHVAEAANIDCDDTAAVVHWLKSR